MNRLEIYKIPGHSRAQRKWQDYSGLCCGLLQNSYHHNNTIKYEKITYSCAFSILVTGVPVFRSITCMDLSFELVYNPKENKLYNFIYNKKSHFQRYTTVFFPDHFNFLSQWHRRNQPFWFMVCLHVTDKDLNERL